MADEDLATPAVETPSEPVAVEEVQTPETQEQPKDVGEPEPPEGDESPDDAPEEEDELDFAFKKYKVPKSLKSAVEALRADYTQKTQGAAETAKALDARKAEIDQQAKATDEELDARATLKGVEKTLAEYAKLTPDDWAAHEQNDFVGTQAAWRNYQLLQAQKAELSGIVTKAHTERTEKAQQDLAKRVQETIAVAQKDIPGWKPELTDTLVKFAMDSGIPEDTIKSNWSPTFYKLLHQAHIGQQAIKQSSAPKPAPKPAITPLATVKAASSPTASRSLADMASSDDMEAYIAARKAGRVR